MLKSLRTNVVVVVERQSPCFAARESLGSTGRSFLDQ